ncbi:MAG: hypothetical protein Tsb0015_02250 [Simkaniaceae bacterium]
MSLRPVEDSEKNFEIENPKELRNPQKEEEDNNTSLTRTLSQKIITASAREARKTFSYQKSAVNGENKPKHLITQNFEAEEKQRKRSWSMNHMAMEASIPIDKNELKIPAKFKEEKNIEKALEDLTFQTLHSKRFFLEFSSLLMQKKTSDLSRAIKECNKRMNTFDLIDALRKLGDFAEKLEGKNHEKFTAAVSQLDLHQAETIKLINGISQKNTRFAQEIVPLIADRLLKHMDDFYTFVKALTNESVNELKEDNLAWRANTLLSKMITYALDKDHGVKKYWECVREIIEKDLSYYDLKSLCIVESTLKQRNPNLSDTALKELQEANMRNFGMMVAGMLGKIYQQEPATFAKRILEDRGDVLVKYFRRLSGGSQDKFLKLFKEKDVLIQVLLGDFLFLRLLNPKITAMTSELKNKTEDSLKRSILIQLSRFIQRLANRAEYEDDDFTGLNPYLELITPNHIAFISKTSHQKFEDN